MTKRLIYIVGLLLCALAAAGPSNDPTTAASAECETVTDASIVTSIKVRIEADSELKGQMRHINVVSINRVVKLQGWVADKDDYDDVHEIAMTTPCVKAVNVNDFHQPEPSPGSGTKPGSEGCGPGMKACGDICIPEGDACNILELLKQD